MPITEIGRSRTFTRLLGHQKDLKTLMVYPESNPVFFRKLYAGGMSRNLHETYLHYLDNMALKVFNTIGEW